MSRIVTTSNLSKICLLAVIAAMIYTTGCSTTKARRKSTEEAQIWRPPTEEGTPAGHLLIGLLQWIAD